MHTQTLIYVVYIYIHTHTHTYLTHTHWRPVSVNLALTLQSTHIHFVCPKVGIPFRLSIALPKVYSSGDAWHVVSSTAGAQIATHSEETLVVSSKIWEENLNTISNWLICIIPHGLDVFRAPRLERPCPNGSILWSQLGLAWPGNVQGILNLPGLAIFSPFRSDHPAAHQMVSSHIFPTDFKEAKMQISYAREGETEKERWNSMEYARGP